MKVAGNTVDEMIDKLAQLGFYTRLFEITKSYHATLEEVMGLSREQRISHARHACWAYLRGLTRSGKPVLSYPNIGDLFGVNNTSVHHGVRAHRERKRLEMPAPVESETRATEEAA